MLEVIVMDVVDICHLFCPRPQAAGKGDVLPHQHMPMLVGIALEFFYSPIPKGFAIQFVPNHCPTVALPLLFHKGFDDLFTG